MREDSKAIREDIDKLCEKYGIEKGILMFEQKVEDKQYVYRTLVFQQKELKRDKIASAMADVFVGCIEVSKTMQRIVNEANQKAMKAFFRKNKNIVHEMITEGMDDTQLERVD